MSFLRVESIFIKGRWYLVCIELLQLRQKPLPKLTYYVASLAVELIKLEQVSLYK